MKKSLLLLIFTFCFAIINHAHGERIVKVGAFNYYPGIFKDTDGEVKGFFVDALNELGQNENIKFIYVYGSWEQGLERIKTGEIDMLTSVAYTKERAVFMDYAQTPLLTVWGEVYVEPKSEIKGIKDLNGKTIAVMKSDFNGEFLRQLTTKLSINCNYIETNDFDEVFQLILTEKVDAGVVNNTYGAPKSQEYSLLSSGIVFNPFDIFFTVKKGENAWLLKLLNMYLETWVHDRNSVYNVSRQKWSHGKVGKMEVFPEWLQNGIYAVVVFVLLLMAFIGLLRYRVRKATAKLKYSETLFETFMDNTPAFVYIKDEALNHIYRNKMLNNIVNNHLINNISSAKTIFEPETAETIEQTDRVILDLGKGSKNIQFQCNLNGETVWLHDYKFFIALPDGKPGIGGISIDMTRLKETELELIKAKEKAEESDRLKSAFLANMSHEIRTPMNGILGFASLLNKPGLTGDQQHEYIEIIRKSGARMLNIINDIVDISKIEAGLMNLELSESNVNEQLEYIYTFFKPEADAKGLMLQFNLALAAPKATILTDREKLFAVLTNLVKNAIKYTTKGLITFGYELKNNQKNQKELQFFVKDTGIGISPNRIDAIFERFVQADIEDKMARQGAGLGLSISKAYVDMMGGEIWVESEKGRGSVFGVLFYLPYRACKKRSLLLC
ncbi:MAG: transporter substrate-binding domain-containing protein [Lentimicrobium sp.]|nr:transporter substrate-binding domain-containing protein [Lentimicrobium sp.]